nr:putative replication associated protein [Crucivirus sp.]
MTKKGFPWTLNNYTEDEVQNLSNTELHEERSVRFMLFVKQIGDEKTPHLQGYTQYFTSVRWTALKQYSKRIHVEKKQMGSAQQNIDYIVLNEKKTNVAEPYSWGTPCLAKGERTDLKVVAETIIKEQLDEKQVALEFPGVYMRYANGIRGLCRQVHKPKPYVRATPLELHIIYGPSGIGKTYAAEQKFIDGNMSAAKISQLNLKGGWWDDYNGEDVIFLDEFRDYCMYPENFLQLVDRMKKLPVKGQFIDCPAKAIWITTPDHPYEWWKKWMSKTSNNWAQLSRRITKLYKMDSREEGLVEISPQDASHCPVIPEIPNVQELAALVPTGPILCKKRKR